MAKMQNHHPDFQSSQKKINRGKIYDDRTIPLEKSFHNKITNQVLYEGVPMITAVGEIDVDDISKGRYPRNKEYKKRWVSSTTNVIGLYITSWTNCKKAAIRWPDTIVKSL